MNSQDFRNLQEAYLDVYELDEGAAENVANRAQKLANQKGQTPERKKIYQDLANKARERDEAQNPNPMRSVGSSRFEYNQKHGRPLITPEVSQSRSSQGTLGGVTYQRGPNRLPKSQRKYDRQVLSGVRAASEQEKQRARERMGIKEDIYDIILSHLLDEGYAETPEQAEVIMVNMSEDWRESIYEELTGPRKKRALEIGGPVANRIVRGNEGQPLETKSGGLVTMRTAKKGPTNRGGGGVKGRPKSDWYGNDETHGSGNASARRQGKKVKDTSDEL
jgi:hypothetical protein